jgi:hypothetical protein
MAASSSDVLKKVDLIGLALDFQDTNTNTCLLAQNDAIKKAGIEVAVAVTFRIVVA